MNNLKHYILFTLFWLNITLATAISLLYWTHKGRTYFTVAKKTNKIVTSFFHGADRKIMFHEISISDNIILQKYSGRNSGRRFRENPTSDTLDANDSLSILMLNDSSSFEDTLYYTDFSYELGGDNNTGFSNNSGDDGIVVMRDRLLFSRTYEAYVPVQEGNKGLNLDSLLIGGKTSKESHQYLVEFWESPLNYKGYKRTRNRIVLYGIRDAELVSFKVCENILYLKYVNDYYVIENNPSYQHLYPVRDQQKINKLRAL